MVSIGLVFLMGILGLVVDIGWGYYRKQVAQAAVDAAVTAAVVAAGTGTIACGTGNVICPSSKTCSDSAITAGSNIKAGCQYGVQNGIGSGNLTMSANVTTPISGVDVKYWVTATASEPLLPTFLRTMGFNSATVAAQATGAVVATGSGSGGGCLYVLDPSAGQALYLNGANLTVTCGVYLNSSSTSNAFQLNSAAATLNTAANGLTMVTGAKISCSGCGCKTDAYYGTQNPSNTTQCTDPVYASAAADPLAAIPAPTYSGCDHTNYSWSNLSPAQTINPGVYCGGINVGGGTVTFNPGNYILNGGGLKIQGSNTTVSGNGVFFYNTASGYTAGSLLVSGQPHMDFKAPTSGTYQGIMFMQDHSVCPSTQHAFQGNSNVKTNGTIYVHCTQTGGGYVAQSMLYTGQSTSGYYSALVVDTIQINGMSNLVLDPTGGANTGIGLGGGNKPFLIQ
jgi:hypothetical protein